MQICSFDPMQYITHYLLKDLLLLLTTTATKLVVRLCRLYQKVMQGKEEKCLTATT